MNNKLIIRKETKEDYKNTELVTMRSFWNLYEPGCREHLVLRKMREDESYLPEISRVAEMNGRIVGGIFYTKAKVVGAAGETQVATFGPLCVEPTLHNLGIGKELLERTIPLVKESLKVYAIECDTMGKPLNQAKKMHLKIIKRC